MARLLPVIITVDTSELEALVQEARRLLARLEALQPAAEEPTPAPPLTPGSNPPRQMIRAVEEVL